MRRVFFFLIFGLLFVTAASAQTLVNFSRNGAMTVAETNQLITKTFGSAVAPTERAIELYKITYRSRDGSERFTRGSARRRAERLDRF